MDKEVADQIIRGGNPVRGYVYDENGRYDESHWFEGTPENIANFIGKNLENRVTITDPLDRLVANTRFSFLDQCPDPGLCSQIQEYLIPIQMGEVEAKEIPSFTDSEYNRMCELEELQQDQDYDIQW